MASGGKEIKLLKHVSPVKPRDDFVHHASAWGWGGLGGLGAFMSM